MRWIVDVKAPHGCAASPSKMGRFETRWLTAAKNRSALADLSGQWIDKVHRRRPARGDVLDMDSSGSPTRAEQEQSVWNGHNECTCYNPLFVFNQFGDLESCALRPGNVQSADQWEGVHWSRSWRAIAARSRASISAPTRVSPISRSTSTTRLRASSMRSGSPPTVSYKSGLATCSRVGRASAERSAPFLCELHLSSRNLDEAASRRRQGRMASGRTLPAPRLHRHQRGQATRERRRLLQ
jgi:hypothetical protein